MKSIRDFANGLKQGTPAANLRLKRAKFFSSFISDLPRPISILDIGGNIGYYKALDILDPQGFKVTLLNLPDCFGDIMLPGFVSYVGDGRNMPEFHNGQFDVVFSNSTIEHVGNLKEQYSFAREVQRVGRRYFIQTPNKYFPLEPHFLFPFFQFFPLSLRALIYSHFTLGWMDKASSYFEAMIEAESIRLLTVSELRFLFPRGKIWEEKLYGLTKSFVVYGGEDIS